MSCRPARCGSWRTGKSVLKLRVPRSRRYGARSRICAGQNPVRSCTRYGCHLYKVTRFEGRQKSLQCVRAARAHGDRMRFRLNHAISATIRTQGEGPKRAPNLAIDARVFVLAHPGAVAAGERQRGRNPRAHHATVGPWRLACALQPVSRSASAVALRNAASMPPPPHQSPQAASPASGAMMQPPGTSAVAWA